MDQIRTAHETNNELGNDVQLESSRIFKDLRTLSDLELVCVGGGDTSVPWP
jgi:hypothetical protein